MTSAPADLVGFRSHLLQVTGLSGAALGIAPDAAHLSGGGYHVGVEDIQRIGRWNSDYSTRQTRDRRDGTNTASAVDIGSAWKSGRAAWLRFNNLLYQEMRDRPQNLPALRAINVSLDGTAKRRYDQLHRADGLIVSKDTVDTHTHCEFWRDTEGRRAATLDRIVQIMQAAVSGSSPAAMTGDDMANTWTFMDQPTGDQWRISQNAGWTYLNGQARDTVLAIAAARAADASSDVKLLLAAAAADEVRDKANTAAIEALAAALKAGGGSVEAAPIIDAVNAVRDEARREYAAAAERAAAQDSRIADLEEQLARAVAAAEANLSPAERNGLPAT